MTSPTGDAALGARIRTLRLEQGLALKAIAARAGVSLPYLSEIERGAKQPSLDVLVRVADALGTTVVDLLRGLGRYG